MLQHAIGSNLIRPILAEAWDTVGIFLSNPQLSVIEAILKLNISRGSLREIPSSLNLGINVTDPSPEVFSKVIESPLNDLDILLGKTQEFIPLVVSQNIKKYLNSFRKTNGSEQTFFDFFESISKEQTPIFGVRRNNHYGLVFEEELPIERVMNFIDKDDSSLVAIHSSKTEVFRIMKSPSSPIVCQRLPPIYDWMTGMLDKNIFIPYITESNVRFQTSPVDWNSIFQSVGFFHLMKRTDFDPETRRIMYRFKDDLVTTNNEFEILFDKQEGNFRGNARDLLQHFYEEMISSKDLGKLGKNISIPEYFTGARLETLDLSKFETDIAIRKAKEIILKAQVLGDNAALQIRFRNVEQNRVEGPWHNVVGYENNGSLIMNGPELDRPLYFIKPQDLVNLDAQFKLFIFPDDVM